MRPPSPSIPEKEFFLSALAQGLRLDGRALLASRPIDLVFGAELGYVEASLGKTRVAAQVSAQMIRPTPERPYEGVLSVNAEISPMAGSEYEAGRPSDDEVALARMLDKVLRRSDALDKESLCIIAGQRVWHLRLTLHILSSSGNALDTCILAALAALKHMRLPEVELVGDSEVIVHPPEARAPVPLSVNHAPYCLTFGLYTVDTATGASKGKSKTADTSSGRTVAVLDPAGLEEKMAMGTLSVAVNAQKELCVVHKAGGVPLSNEEVTGLVQVAVREVVEWDKRVKILLDEDWAARRAGVEVR